MPDFTARFVANAEARIYTDDYIPPVRNPQPNHPPVRWKNTSPTQVNIGCAVDGVEWPMDSALAGRLFTAWCVEWPNPATPEPPIIGNAGQSSLQTLYWVTDPTAVLTGHYVIGIRREGGGAVLLHLDIV